MDSKAVSERNENAVRRIGFDEFAWSKPVIVLSSEHTAIVTWAWAWVCELTVEYCGRDLLNVDLVVDTNAQQHTDTFHRAKSVFIGIFWSRSYAASFHMSANIRWMCSWTDETGRRQTTGESRECSHCESRSHYNLCVCVDRTSIKWWLIWPFGQVQMYCINK